MALWNAESIRAGMVQGVLILPAELVPPETQTTCAAGVGIGNATQPAPVEASVTGMNIVVLNSVTGLRTAFLAFSFLPNQNTTRGLTDGADPGGLPNTQPVFPGSIWSGFASDVAPFTLPLLGADEWVALEFTIEFPETLLPLTLDVQFAGGEGQTDGTPIFDGEHPVQYFAPTDTSVVFTQPETVGGTPVWLIACVVSGECVRHVE